MNLDNEDIVCTNFFQESTLTFWPQLLKSREQLIEGARVANFVWKLSFVRKKSWDREELCWANLLAKSLLDTHDGSPQHCNNLT